MSIAVAELTAVANGFVGFVVFLAYVSMLQCFNTVGWLDGRKSILPVRTK